MGRARAFDSQDVLEKAMLLFWRYGYNGTSMRDLVQATGLAKASLYNAFGNKEDLFIEVLNHYISAKQTKGLTILENTQPARTALETFFANIAKATLDNHTTPGCLLVNTASEQGPHDLQIRQVIDRGMSRTERIIRETIERGIKDGSIHPDTDPETASLCLITMLVGIRVMACKGIEQERLENLIQTNLTIHTPVAA